ncbi:splicing factor, CC1-like protein, partial [Aureobasidium sp. EXF-8846]
MGALDISVEELLESAQRDASAQEAQSTTANKDDDGARSRRGTTADVDMKDSDNVSANGSTRSRRKDRSGDRSSRRPDSRERRERYRSSGGDFYRGNGRNRTRSPSDDDRYYRPSDRSRRDDDRPRRRDRDRGDRRSPRRDRGGDSYRGGRAARDRSPPRQRTPEPTDDERDRRTVFVQQLAARLRTKELEAFFTQIGPVKEAQIVKDRVSGRSKGVGYVEFKEEESVQKALGLTGQKLLGIPVIVQLTEAEKNRQARVATGQPTQSNGIPFHRLYVGNIHFSVTEEDLRDVFSPFGELEFVQLQKEENGRSKGYGFVQYVDPAHAKAALADMNGFEIAGRPIRVGLGSDKFTPESTASLLQRFGSQNQAAQFQGSSFSGAGGRGAHAGGNNNFDRAGAREEKGTGGASALDDADVGGVNFNNFSRDSLMRKLARTEDPAPQTQATSARPRADTKKTAMHTPAPSRCIVVKNAYDEATQTDPHWAKDLEEDFKEECSSKYGKVVHIGVFRDSSDGEIYVKFADLAGGDSALKGLNGRYFDGRTLTATPVVDAVYNMNFPKAAS